MFHDYGSRDIFFLKFDGLSKAAEEREKENMSGITQQQRLYLDSTSMVKCVIEYPPQKKWLLVSFIVVNLYLYGTTT